MSVLSPNTDARTVRRRHMLWLAAILALGLALRLGYFAAALHTPGYVWEDPDGYMAQARKLAGNGAGWRWTLDAVTYEIEGRRHALPPGYSVFLSLFAVFPGFPLTAQIAQILLAGLSIVLVFALGRLLHSTRTGLIAATGYAVWIPNIFNVWSTSQETLYLPLILLGFVLLSRAAIRDAGPATFAAVGLVFGLAALTRSMPLFFVPPAAALHVAAAANRRRATLQAAVFVAAFLLVIVPYSAALSRHFGQLTVIDTHGSIHLDVTPGQQAPGLAETAGALWRAMSARPAAFLADCLERARTLLYVNGGRILQIYVVADTRAGAAGWKGLVHTGADGLLLLAVLLAPIGAALCRERRAAALLLLWAAVNIAIASLGGFGGARLRAPFEPLMVVLAAVVLAGEWQRGSRYWIAAGLAVTAAGGAAVLPQVPRSLRAWPDYGVEWPSILSRPSGRMSGGAGINVPVTAGYAEFTVAASDDVDVSVSADGVDVQKARVLRGRSHRIRARWPNGGLAYLEIRAQRAEDGRPAALDIVVPR